MKTLRFAATIALVLTAVAGSEARAATATADAFAVIVTAISIENTVDLNFGEVAAGSTDGTVIISPAGSRTATGGVTLGSGASATAASFTVTGEAGMGYDIDLPTSILISDNGNDMTVDTFTSDPNGSGTLGGGGTQTLNVGATLVVPMNQPSGSYAGTFDVTVVYN